MICFDLFQVIEVPQLIDKAFLLAKAARIASSKGVACCLALGHLLHFSPLKSGAAMCDFRRSVLATSCERKPLWIRWTGILMAGSPCIPMLWAWASHPKHPAGCLFFISPGLTKQTLVFLQGTLGDALLVHRIQPGSKLGGSPVEGFTTGLHLGRE